MRKDVPIPINTESRFAKSDSYRMPMKMAYNVHGG